MKTGFKGLIKKKSLSLGIFSILMTIAPKMAMAQNYTNAGAKQVFLQGGSVVGQAITFVFWLLALIELVDFLSNLSTGGFFMKIFRPAFMILFALKWQTIVGWFI